MNEAADLAKMTALIDAQLAIARAEGAYIPEEFEDIFRLGFNSALRYVVQNAAENQRKEST